MMRFPIFKMLERIDGLNIFTLVLMTISTLQGIQGIRDFRFTKYPSTCSRYGNNYLLWKMNSRSLLFCAQLCHEIAGCVSFLFDDNKQYCYGFKESLQDQTQKTEIANGSRYYELNSYNKVTTWKLMMQTGTTSTAATDHAAFASIYGTKGAILNRRLNNVGYDDRQRGKTDVYYFADENIGIPLKIYVLLVEVRGRSYGGWLLNRVTLQNSAETTYTVLADHFFPLDTSKTFDLKEKCD